METSYLIKMPCTVSHPSKTGSTVASVLVFLMPVCVQYFFLPFSFTGSVVTYAETRIIDIARNCVAFL